MQQRSRLWGLISLCGALILDVNLILRGKVQSFTQRYVHLDLSFPFFVFVEVHAIQHSRRHSRNIIQLASIQSR